MVWTAGWMGGCAPPEPTMHVSMPVAMSVALSDCSAPPADFQELLTAELRIGGHSPCPLDVDAADGTVSGACEEITSGIVRPLALVWGLPPPATGPVVRLSYHVTYVDLRDEAVEAGVNEIAIEFPNDGTEGIAWWHPDHVADIPVPESNSSSCQGAECLAVAQSWAEGETLIEGDPIPLLDHDGDGCPNLSEACQGGATLLYDTSIANTDPSTGQDCLTQCDGNSTCTCCAYPQALP